MSTQPIVIQQKSNSTFGTAMKIIGFICLISCLCSIWSSYRTARAVGNAFENMDVKRKERNPGPIITDMEIITRDSTPSGTTTMDMSSDEPQAEPVTTKDMKIALYKTADCTDEPIDSVTLTAGAFMSAKGKFDKRDTDKEDNYVCCIKHENAKLAGEYTKAGEKKNFGISSDGQTNIIEFGEPDGPENCATDFFANWAPLE
jgi:hypothetical protein